MKLSLKAFTIVSFFLLVSCSQNDIKESSSSSIQKPLDSLAKRSTSLSEKTIFPLEIKYKSIGLGSSRQPTVYTLTADSVRIACDKFNVSGEEGLIQFSLPMSETNYTQMLSKFSTADFAGKKEYRNPGIRDGGMMMVSNQLGERKFVNAHFKIGEDSRIIPDTIGLNKYRALSKYSNQLLRKLVHSYREEQYRYSK